MVSTSEDLDDFESQNNGQPFEDEINFSVLAPTTGGQAFFSRNDINNEVKEAINQGATYYTLTYSPTNLADTSSDYRSIRIRMSNPDLTATTRDGFFTDTGNENAVEKLADDAKTVKKTLEAEMGIAAMSNLGYSALNTSMDRGLGDIINLKVDAGDLTWTPTKDGKFRAEITMLNVAFNAKNKILGHASDELFALAPSEIKNPTQKVIFKVHMPQPVGTNRIRFIVRDAVSGKLGTVETKVP